MFHIDKEMAEMAEKLSKAANLQEESEMKEMDKLLNTIEALGAEGLKKALPNLSDSQKTLLKDVLEKAKAKKGAKKVDDSAAPAPANVKDLDSHEIPKKKGGADDEDEKMVKDEMAEHKHQGDNSPEGFDGQEIKDPSPGEKGSAPADEKPLKKATKNPDAKADAQMAEKVEAIVDQHKKENASAEAEEKKMKKSCGKCEGDCKCMKKSNEGNSMVSDEKMMSVIEKAVELDLPKEEFIAKAKAKGGDEKKMSEMFDDAKEKKMKKASAKDLKDKKSEQKAEPKPKELKPSPEPKDEKPMKKSIVWTNKTEQLLKASIRRGQNAHYTVEDSLLKSEADRAMILEKGGYLNEGEVQEELKKSQGFKKETINDLIEKSMDMSGDKFAQAQANVASKPAGGFNTESFSIEEMAKSLNISLEKAKEILGDEKK